MPDAITIITPSRFRNHCFALLEQYIARQDFAGEVQWVVVVDGGAERYRFTMNQDVIVRDPSKDTLPSINHNYLAALPYVKHDKIACVEDDDVYLPGYLTELSGWLDKYDLAGGRPARYYNLRHHQYRTLTNLPQASLAQTGFRGSVLPVFRQIAEIDDPWIDGTLWAHAVTLDLSRVLFDSAQHVGMKGLWLNSDLQPGVEGYGAAHVHNGNRYDYPGNEVLRQWIGEEYAKHYE